MTPSPAPEQTLRLVLGRGDALFAALTLDQDHVLPWDFMQGEQTTHTPLPMYDVPVAGLRVVTKLNIAGPHAQTCID